MDILKSTWFSKSNSKLSLKINYTISYKTYLSDRPQMGLLHDLLMSNFLQHNLDITLIKLHV